VVLPDSSRVPRAPPYSGSSHTKSSTFQVQGFHLLWRPFPVAFPYMLVFSLRGVPCMAPCEVLLPPHRNGASLARHGFGLFPFRSPLLRESRLISFPPGTEMVHFPGFARTRLWIQRAVQGFYPCGFPHSEIPGSKPACGSPRLIAACHVLHRHLPPRHPPCALSSLTIKFTQHSRSCDRPRRQTLRRHRLIATRLLRTGHTSRSRHS
jgi:hypothetical protein